ncbi:MAG: hypothetical protein ABSH44_16720 [Bryobacteraceae bacterium]|jgi:opacity protein-like surface antigen
MTKKLLFVLTILLVAAFALMAADVTGKWVYEQPGRGGGNPTQVTLNLKVDAGKLTGSVVRPGRGGEPMETQISEGKVDGDNISFKVTTQMGGNAMTTEYTGAVSGNEMKLKITRPGRDGTPTTNEFTAKRSTT